MIKHFLIIYYIAIFLSCKKHSTDLCIINDNLINLEKTSILTEQVVDTIEMIALDSMMFNASKVKSIDHILEDDEGYVLVDLKTSTILFLRKADNKLILIGNRGTGPEEFIKVSDIAIDRSSNSILVLCNSNSKIYWYGYDGKFKKTVKADFYLYNFAFIGQNKLAFYSGYMSNGKYDVLITNDNTIIQKRLFKLPKGENTSLYNYTGIVKNSGNAVFYSPIGSSIIYKFHDNQFCKYIQFAHPKLFPESDIYDLNKFSKFEDDIENSYLISPRFQIDSLSNWGVFSIREGRRIVNNFVNLKSFHPYTLDKSSSSLISALFHYNTCIGVSPSKPGGLYFYVSEELVGNFSKYSMESIKLNKLEQIDKKISISTIQSILNLTSNSRNGILLKVILKP